MKVYVTQGHEEGIGLEVFFKTCLFLGSQDLKRITLIAFRPAVHETLLSLELPFEIQDETILLVHKHIHVLWLEEINVSPSFSALEMGMRLAETGGVLFTLPTSKDQFPGQAGHTEYFRHFYRKPDIGMYFSSPLMQALLVTDHVAIKELPDILTEERLYKSLETFCMSLKSWNWKTERILVAGLNPHAGESGIIGTEDERVKKSIKRIQDKFKIDITGPYPGDTILRERKSPEDVLVFLYHDQGLALFKGISGLIGSNISLGLPYPRFSPDHGTSFSLFGKNSADYRGCQYSLEEALKLLERLEYDGQNSGHKSKSS
jgi:4-hydroxythreonine-4-phosphate dehydrogenase